MASQEDGAEGLYGITVLKPISGDRRYSSCSFRGILLALARRDTRAYGTHHLTCSTERLCTHEHPSLDLQGHRTPIHRRSGACRSNGGLALVHLKTVSTSEICMPCLARTLELVDALDTTDPTDLAASLSDPGKKAEVRHIDETRQLNREMLGGTDHYAETGTGAEHPDMLDNSGNLAGPLWPRRSGSRGKCFVFGGRHWGRIIPTH